MSKPIFVIGCPRSGNTLCGSILNKHPDLLILFETRMFWELDRLWLRRSKIEGGSPERLFAELVHARLARYNEPAGVALADIVDRVRDRGPAFGPMLDAYVRLLMERVKPEASRWGDKTPHHAITMRRILDSYSDAQFVSVVRSPLGTVNSLSKKSFPYATDNNLLNAEIVRRALIRYERQKRLVPADNLLEIRYEAIVDAPEQTVRRICDFLGVAYHDHLLGEADQRTREFIGEPRDKSWSRITPQASQKTTRIGPLVRAHIGAWNRRLGYPVEARTFGGLYRILAFLRVLPFRLLHVVLSAGWAVKYPGFPFIMQNRPTLRNFAYWIRLKETPES